MKAIGYAIVFAWSDGLPKYATRLERNGILYNGVGRATIFNKRSEAEAAIRRSREYANKHGYLWANGNWDIVAAFPPPKSKLKKAGSQ